MLSCQQDLRYTKERNDLRGNTSGTELSVAETAGQLGDGVTGTGEEVEEEGGGDIGTGGVLDLLEGGSETVLVGAICKFCAFYTRAARLTSHFANKPL
jgi:hypothetical protein